MISEASMELRAALIAKHREVILKMRFCLDKEEVRRLAHYARDLHDAVHGWEQEVVGPKEFRS